MLQDFSNVKNVPVYSKESWKNTGIEDGKGKMNRGRENDRAIDRNAGRDRQKDGGEQRRTSAEVWGCCYVGKGVHVDDVDDWTDHAARVLEKEKEERELSQNWTLFWLKPVHKTESPGPDWVTGHHGCYISVDSSLDWWYTMGIPGNHYHPSRTNVLFLFSHWAQYWQLYLYVFVNTYNSLHFLDTF